MNGAHHSSSGRQAGPTLDRTPSRHRASHPLTRGQWRHATSSHTHIFGMGAETGGPRENPHKHGDSGQTPHTDTPAQNRFSIFSHQCYNEMIFNETTIRRSSSDIISFDDHTQTPLCKNITM